MKRKITQKKIAEELGISPAAVSFCLNGKNGVSEALRAKVLALAEKKHYTGKTLPIAVVFHESDSPVNHYLQPLFNELNIQCRSRNIPVFFLSSRNESLLRHENFRGVLSLDYTGSTGIKLPEREPLPIISINDRSHPLNDVYCVYSNETKMFRKLFEHLLGKGHTRIGYCYTGFCGPGFFPRFRQKTMRDVAAEFRELKIYEGQITAEHPVVENILKLRREKITALIVAGESYEFKARQAIQLLNIRLPDELALVTWENPGESEYYVPAQTTVGQNFPLLVKTALDNLEELIAGNPVSNTEIDYILNDRETW